MSENLICRPSQYSPLKRANSNGFAALPNELFLEILSHFPSDTFIISSASAAQIIRRETLHSLSAVCQDLRRVFRPHLWQRVEVYPGMLAGNKRRLDHNDVTSQRRSRLMKDFAKELLRQLNVVTIQDPSLAQCVRMVNIEINAAPFRPVFDGLCQCFSLFPNLHTVRIITKFSRDSYADRLAATAFKCAFIKNIPYPQIRSAILSKSVFPLLAVCPNLESFTTFEPSPVVLTFMKGLPVLQQHLCPLSLAEASATAEALTSLEQLILSLEDSTNYTDGDYITKVIKTIRLFPKLRTLIFGRRMSYRRRCVSVESLKQAFVNLQPCDRQIF